ncbi:MAG: hypothetical protein JJ953_11085 [Gracilimonas sp.]|uniref:hypothetical protein n=1 Tax=Gracilimonas TaxID=649462 RepID=UPI001B26133E|nr:hypothetical protein [Gracilimonas sp.]MBO6586640.1 hypothetical protein [Gracilimonas sp.]MBO6615297.1 hypothetical protein [Gracilimonas sp.]
MKRLTGFIALIFLMGGCAAYKLDTAQNELRTSFASGDYATTVQLIEKLEKNEVYQNKEKVLLHLEHGLVNHFASNYEQSSYHFTQAENEMDVLFSKSMSRAVKSFVVNDNTLAYDGEDYEDIYLNIFKCLNYIHQDELESALVEVRRVTYKLERLDQKYNGLVESLSKADTTSTDDDKWKTGDTNIQNSALGRYLSTILYAKTNKPDDARIEYENLLKAYREQPSVYGNKPDESKLRQITEPERYNVLVQAFAGRAPIKEQNDIRLYLDESDTYLKFSLPSLKTFNSQVSAVKVNFENGNPVQLDLIEEMDQVAKEVYKVKEPIIYARTFVRTFLKAAAAAKMKKEAKKEDETLGSIVNILGKIAQETTEKADLRSWQTMPGKAYATVLNLPPGDHNVEVQYYGHTGQLIHAQPRIITVRENETLKLVESIYWN